MAYLERIFRLAEEENRRSILAVFPAGCRSLLDIGTHGGEFTARVAQRVGAERVVGVELIEEHAARARERGIETVVADANAGLPFADAVFDVVHANQVIEHLRATDVFLKEVRRVLAPGGVACVSTNNLASWHNVLSLALGFQPTPMHVSDELILGNPLNPAHGRRHEDGGQTHLRLFTARALCELAAHHGLRAAYLTSAGYYPLPPRLARIATRIDRAHGAFLIALFARA